MPPSKTKLCDNGIIYKLYSYQDEKYYWGSTGGTLKNRKYAHKNRSQESKLPLYEWVRRIGIDNLLIKEIDTYKNITVGDLLKREDELICNSRGDENCLNCIRASITEEEKHQQMLNNGKKYNATHKEAKQKYNKEYNPQYYQNHKEEAKEYSRQYRENNKDEINRKQREAREKN